mmetsp:Transcript_17614/g.50112  ORF Transcript_17614/g.50112 Transcript_17614/m.50112 type:complete len:131 (+) Transcript_17614:51-443(+)
MPPSPHGDSLGLAARGFLAPDFSLQRLRSSLSSAADLAAKAGAAADHAAEGLGSAVNAGEQTARHADRLMRLPSSELPPQAFGEFEGSWPPRWKAGACIGTWLAPGALRPAPAGRRRPRSYTTSFGEAFL